jgi:predicted RNA-binding Zn-ribbon protein involved in translation (DUF1610 family)
MHKDPEWLDKVTKHCKKMAQDPGWQEKQKIRTQKRTIPKVQYACIDCGKLSKSKRATRFRQTPETYRCKPCTLKKVRDDKYHHNSRWVEKQRIAREALETKRANRKPAIAKVQQICIDCGKLSTWRIPSAFRQPPETYRCYRCAQIEWYTTPLNKGKAEMVRKKMYQNPTWKENVIKGAQKRAKDPVAIMNAKIAQQKLHQNPVWKENHLITASGEGFWYGHRTLHPENRQKQYCEKWCKDLWVRIDAAWDYKSAISGKTRFDNYRKAHLDRHHVYWQEKACCVWDGDAQGYYAMINLGTKAKPNMYKHYIKGDPNKFVLLTHSEHQKIRGNKKQGTTKLTWIKYFEDMIEKREAKGKHCYLTHDEYGIYKVENADTISIYNPPKIKKQKQIERYQPLYQSAIS